MDRRSWLWRRKSSEKNAGDTESSGSGSISSPSERFSDEQQAYSNQNMQSPEVTSKTAPPDEDVNDSVKILTAKLSAALANVTAKEELVQQHAKVAEEAVTGWEKAEKEVTTLRQQLDASTKKNTSLEDRVVHLDAALKECLRQLRQVREEQDQKIREAISEKSQDWERQRSELEEKLVDLRAQLETANAKAETAASSESDLHLRLESYEKENTSLRVELHSLLEELKVRTFERDLSTKTAETASRQHLESIKKVAKLEAECRRLQTMARKKTLSNDHKSSFTESQSDSAERLTELDQFKAEKEPSKNPMNPTREISLMDDFLQMERLAAAALPESEKRNCSTGVVNSVDKHSGNDENQLKSDLEAMINRTSELEEKIEMLEAEKASFAQLQAQFSICQNQLKISQGQLRDANKRLSELQAELDLANEVRQAIGLELEDANGRREGAESKLESVQDESKILLSKLGLLESEVGKERALYVEASSKRQALEDELSRTKLEVDAWKSRLSSMKDSKEAVEREIKAVENEVKSLLAKVGSLEEAAEKERRLSIELVSKCRNLELELSSTKRETDMWQSRLALANESKEAVELELQTTKAKKKEAESQLKASKAEAKSLLDKVGLLEAEAGKERALSSEFAVKCRKLEDELSKMKREAELRLASRSKEELNIQQEKELAEAAGKLAECQKTIASLGKQLKSLATLEDLFLDSEKLLEVPQKDTQSHLFHKW